MPLQTVNGAVQSPLQQGDPATPHAPPLHPPLAHEPCPPMHGVPAATHVPLEQHASPAQT